MANTRNTASLCMLGLLLSMNSHQAIAQDQKAELERQAMLRQAEQRCAEYGYPPGLDKARCVEAEFQKIQQDKTTKQATVRAEEERSQKLTECKKFMREAWKRGYAQFDPNSGFREIERKCAFDPEAHLKIVVCRGESTQKTCGPISVMVQP